MFSSQASSTAYTNNQALNVTSNITQNTDGSCTQEVVINGRGIQDTFSMPCSQPGTQIVNDGDSLIVGDPARDPMALFTDEPATLYVFTPGSCYKVTYSSVNGNPVREEHPVDAATCLQLLNSIAHRLQGRTSYQRQWMDYGMRFATPNAWPWQLVTPPGPQLTTGHLDESGSLSDCCSSSTDFIHQC